MDTRLLVSLVILLLPLLGFVVQLVLGRMKTPTDYVIDPHENPGHDHGHHGNPADLHTADHTQTVVDDPHEAHAHVTYEVHTAGHHAHYEDVVSKRRDSWTEADQKR